MKRPPLCSDMTPLQPHPDGGRRAGEAAARGVAQLVARVCHWWSADDGEEEQGAEQRHQGARGEGQEPQREDRPQVATKGKTKCLLIFGVSNVSKLRGQLM